MTVLEWAQHLVGPALRRSVTRLPPSVRRVADYHFAWPDTAAGRGAGGGKAIRPALALLFAQALGGDAKNAVPAAVVVELVHNFSLLHDDVMDRDTLRRHRPAAWTVFGTSQAILAGDALLTLAWQVLSEQKVCPSISAMAQLSSALMELVEGQSADVAFENRVDVGLDECIAMAANKSGSLIGVACMLGAQAGGASTEQAQYAQQYGHNLGLAFQLVDDLLGVWGDPEVTGKPVFADLAIRKKSLPVVAALTSATSAGEELAALYQRPDQLDEADLRRAALLVEQAGGRHWCESQARKHLQAAGTCLDILGPDARTRARLDALGVMVVERDR
ncbi:polyprenyl synthetase family protein [Kitasatospora herbaricolor]|uniref:polyprenyl synthetase family protein n=1 Tax=Kitasatospora herbaricolor TaxID=68217 RepID=UPI0036DECA45